MNASKETAQHALDNLLTQEQFMNGYAFRTIKEFLERAKAKLPTEASYARAIANKKKRVKAKA
jgi:hypothetical protein